MKVSHAIAGNQLMLLQNGVEFFPELCADIDSACKAIYLETYIFAADRTGQLVANALRAAAQRGVKVHLLLDGFGSAQLPDAWLDEMRSSGVQVLWFRRDISPFTLKRNRLRRLHRKLAVIDAQTAYLGGINIIDDIEEGHTFEAPRLDFAVRMQGDIALQIQSVMVRLWNMISWTQLRRRERENVAPFYKKQQPQAVTLLLRDNLRHRRDIEQAYLQRIVQAQQEIILANAYFLPGRVFRRALVHASQRGVKVKLLLQGRVEYRLQHYATRALYAQLLQAGIEIYEYQASYMHAKVAVVDEQWLTVGSSNLDPLSLLLAREANLAVQDQGFALALKTQLQAAIAQDGKQILLSDLQSSAWHTLWLPRVSYALIRLVMAVLGYGKH